MCVLSDGDIEEEIKSGRLVIEPYCAENLTPNGYDLTVGEIFVDGTIVEKGEVKPHQWFAISTMERVKLPVSLCAQLWLRSSWARKGIICSFGKVDAGFDGTLTLSAFNASNSVVLVSRGDRFVQIVFERMCSGAKEDYAKRSGRYQGQRGVRL
ncbi:MAG: dCTP deaminase [Thermoplasmata archaeon]|nr:MAG: dCTP deaminase [Thermoplasmata archaeon]